VENELEIFPEVIATTNFDVGLNVFLQGHSIGPVKPNIVMTGWPVEESRAVPFAKHLRTISKLNMSSVVMVNNTGADYPTKEVGGRIDIWWRGRANGSLMLIQAYLLCRNSLWEKTNIRVLRIISDANGFTEAHAEMQELVDAARIDAEIKILVSGEDFNDIYRRESSDAAALFLGYMPPSDEEAEQSFRMVNERQQGMPPTFYVASSGAADFQA